MGKSGIGINNSFYGRKHTEESKAKMRKAHLGKKLTEKHKEKIRSYRHTKEARQKISDAQKGSINHFWQGGIFIDSYPIEFSNILKQEIRIRDNYTCQLCGCEQNGRRLSVHHIHYLKEDCYPDVVALCCSCNTRVNANRDYWEERFENELIARGLFCWSLSREIDNT